MGERAFRRGRLYTVYLQDGEPQGKKVFVEGHRDEWVVAVPAKDTQGTGVANPGVQATYYPDVNAGHRTLLNPENVVSADEWSNERIEVPDWVDLSKFDAPLGGKGTDDVDRGGE